MIYEVEGKKITVGDRELKATTGNVKNSGNYI